MAILGPLRELDQVAYLRFASVYRQFDSVDDFEAEIALLRVESEPTGIEPLIPDRVADGRVSNFVPHKPAPAGACPALTSQPEGSSPTWAGPRSRGRPAAGVRHSTGQGSSADLVRHQQRCPKGRQ